MPQVTGGDEFFVYVQQDDGSSMRIPRGLAAGMGLSGPAAPAPAPPSITDPQLAGDLAGSLPPAPGSAPMPGWPPAPRQQSPGSAPPPLPLQGAPRNTIAAPPAIAPTFSQLAPGDVAQGGPGQTAPRTYEWAPSEFRRDPAAPEPGPSYADRIAAMPSGFDGLVEGARLGGQFAQELGDVEAQQAGLVRAEGMALAREAEGRVRQNEENERLRQADQAEEHQSLVKETEELKRSGVDPNRLYKTASTPQRIVGALSLFLGGFLEPVTGKNSALAIIQQQIERDIDAQKVAIDQKRSAIETRRGLYGMMLERHRDAGKAEALANAGYWQAAAAKLEAMAAPMPEALRLKAAQASLAMNEKADGWLAQAAQTKAEAQARERAGRAAAAAAARKEERRQYEWEREQNRKDADTAAGIEDKAAARAEKERGRTATGDLSKLTATAGFDPKDAERAIVSADGRAVVGLAPSKEVATELRDQLASYDEAKISLAEMIRFQKEEGATYGGWGSDSKLGSEARKRMTGMHEQLLSSLAKANQKGVLSDQDMERWRKVLPPPETWSSQDPVPAWEDVARRLDRGILVKTKRAGLPEYSPVTDEYLSLPEKKTAPKEPSLVDLAIQIATGTPARKDAGLAELRARIPTVEDIPAIYDMKAQLRAKLAAGDDAAAAADYELTKRLNALTGRPTPGERKAAIDSARAKLPPITVDESGVPTLGPAPGQPQVLIPPNYFPPRSR